MKNALIYCRVSTEEQAKEGYSLDAQEKFCAKFAEDDDYRIVGVFRDEGKSATSLNRQALQDLLAKCQQDDSIDAVFVQETDRLARNTKDHLTIRAILQKAGVKLVSVAQPMLDDSPEGNMIDTILASVNQFQSDLNSRKTKKGLQERFNQGWWPGWVPLGYLNVAVGGNADGRKAKKIVKKDPEKWDLTKEAFKLYLSDNYSVFEINDTLYKKGLRSKTGKKVPHSVLTVVLKNPFYAGLMKWNGQEKKGKHDPMISMAEHYRAVRIMENHNQHACRRRKHTFLLRGFAFCNICGQRFTADKVSKRNKEYYHCANRDKHSNHGQNIQVEDLEKIVEEQFKTIQFSPSFAKTVIEKVRGIFNNKKDKINKQKQTLYNKKKATESKRDTAEEKLFKGIITDDDFVRIRDKFRTDVQQIQDQVNKLDEQRELDIDAVQEILKLTRNIYETYKTAPFGLKRQYLGLFWDKFMVQDKQIQQAVPTDLILRLQQESNVLIRKDWLPQLNAIRTCLIGL
ncbi:hypothetical protein AMJ47_01475 [Parcubacteria bacterium DG_72]|nr:MAG: hypothetical protein AMJ47_01475 [Parcubacteria bacterium DG_72]